MLKISKTCSIRPALLIILIAATATLTAVETVACPEAQYKEADHAFMVARDFINARNWTEAIPSLESALAICPEHVNSLRYLGKAHYANERYEVAQVTLEKLLEVTGKDAKSSDYMDLGKTYAKLKDYRKARQAYVNASRLDPDNCSILFNMAVMHGAVKDYPRSVETYEQVLDMCPDLRDNAMPRLVKACQKAAERERSFGNVAEARLYEDKRAEYGSQAGGSVGYQLIVDKMNAKDFAGAATQCEAFLANNPESSKRDRVLLNMARCQRQLESYGPAVTAYRKYLDIKPDDGETAGDLINVLISSERCAEALAEAAEAHARVQDAEQRVYINYYWGKALECDGRYQEAKEKFRWVVANATGIYKNYARDEMGRQDQHMERERAQRQNAGR